MDGDVNVGHNASLLPREFSSSALEPTSLLLPTLSFFFFFFFFLLPRVAMCDVSRREKTQITMLV
jgi:hypothetical protein